MNSISKKVLIKAISVTVPKKVYKLSNILNKKSEKNKIINSSKMLGVNQCHKSNESTTTLDLCYNSAKDVIRSLKWNSKDIDILVFVTQTPDYLMPACSNIIHHKLQLKKECVCYDINLGCSGYVYGLWNITSIMQANKNKKGLLLVGDTISKTVKSSDKINKLLFGDSGSATALSHGINNKMYFIMGSEGKGSKNLMLKKSGFRDKKFNPEFYMDGKEVFYFAVKNIPKLIKDLFTFSKTKISNISFFVFHQANKFMLNKIAENIGIADKKLLFSIKNYGNTSSASIPTTICHEKEKINKSKIKDIIIAGFGAGFSFGAATINLSKTKLLKIKKI